MATLHVIGEFLSNWEQATLRAAARELTAALADAAPRGYGTSLLIATNTEPPIIDHPKAKVETMSLVSAVIPMLWTASTAARPLDGEFVHALSPLAPLRTRDEDDGSQASVAIPHTLAWDAPEALPKGQARVIRKYTRRALKHADVIVTSTHADAERLREIYGSAVQVQVVPLAAPTEYLAGDDAAERRTSLGLPGEYMLTNAYTGTSGRLEWILRAMEADTSLPPLVLVGAAADVDLAKWSVLEGRLYPLRSDDLFDMGATIAGASLFAMPQRVGDCLMPVYAALTSRIPIVHGGAPCIAETVLDAAAVGTSEEEFVAELTRLSRDDEARERLGMFAGDQARMFSWQTTAWQIWEIHANI